MCVQRKRPNRRFASSGVRNTDINLNQRGSLLLNLHIDTIPECNPGP
jgi:hypothetical protein